MALYFSSDTFGTLCVPRLDYTFWDSWSGQSRMIRTDIPITENCLINAYDLLKNAPVGTYVEILSHVWDGVSEYADVGIQKDIGWSGDADAPSFHFCWKSGDTISTASTNNPLVTDGFPTTIVLLYQQYNNVASNPCNLMCLCSNYSQVNAKIIADFGLAAYWSTTSLATKTGTPIQCTYTDDELGLNAGLDFASVQEFVCSKCYYPERTFMPLNSNILLANGGGDFSVPDDFQGSASMSYYLGGGSITLGFHTDSYGGEDANSWYDEILYCGLIDVYNPSASDLRGIAQQLNDSSFISQISKLWDNPIESIVSLFVVPVGVPAAMLSTANIYLGGLDTGISSSKLVPTDGSFGKHSVTVSMGTINITEENCGFFDYSPYNQMSIYLPYIGFRNISASLIMNCHVTLTYEVDFLSGDCSAVLKSVDNRWGHTRCLEVGRGNTAIQVPLTSTNYMGMYAGLLNAGAALATGNIIGAANSAMSMQSSMTHSGSLGGNVGNISPRRAFILSDRPPTYNYINYNATKGRPNNTGVKVGSITGLTIGRIIMEADHMHENAKEAITALFQKGVIV